MSVYSTGGPVRTGRTVKNGDYCAGSLRAKGVVKDLYYSELCAGFAQFDGVKSFSFIPVITWEEYPTGIIDIPISGGNPTSSAPAAIWNSYNSNWTNFGGINSTIHAIELRYYCVLYATTTRRIIWMSPGGGHVYYSSPMTHSYAPARDLDLSCDFAMNIDVGCIERVNIQQLTDDEGNWVWPLHCLKDGMGTTHATFDARADETDCTIKINGESINLPTDYITAGTYTFGCDRSANPLQGKAGLYTSVPAFTGWGVAGGPSFSYQMTNQPVFSSLTEVSRMIFGLKELDLRLRDGQLYQGTDSGYSGLCEGDAQDNTISYKAKNSPASASGAAVYTHRIHTDTGIAYKHEVDFAMMDGSPASDTVDPPEFVDQASGTTWTGNTSPLIVFDGVWELTMRDLAGNVMDTRNTETDASGTGAHWERSNPAPAYI